jgi:hypothetical protein
MKSEFLTRLMTGAAVNRVHVTADADKFGFAFD